MAVAAVSYLGGWLVFGVPWRYGRTCRRDGFDSLPPPPPPSLTIMPLRPILSAAPCDCLGKILDSSRGRSDRLDRKSTSGRDSAADKDGGSGRADRSGGDKERARDSSSRGDRDSSGGGDGKRKDRRRSRYVLVCVFALLLFYSGRSLGVLVVP